MSTARTTSFTPDDATGARGAAARRTRPGRGWAIAGAAAGFAAIVGIQASTQVDAVYVEETAGDAALITERLGDQAAQLLALHVSMTAASLLLLVFAAGLRRRLRAQAPAGSLLPDVAFGGALATAVIALLGVAFTTEIVFGTADEERPIDPEFGAMVGHWSGTVPWLWVGFGLTGVAIAVAALRHAAAPRWIGWVSAVLGSLTLLTGLSPMQYLAGFTGPVLLLVIGVGFCLGDGDEGVPTALEPELDSDLDAGLDTVVLDPQDR